MAKEVKWIGDDVYSGINFGSFIVQVYQDSLDSTKYRYRIGAKQSSDKYTAMNGAKRAGLKKLKEGCEFVIDNIDPLIEEEDRIFKETQNKRLKRTHEKLRKKRAEPKKKIASLFDLGDK